MQQGSVPNRTPYEVPSCCGEQAQGIEASWPEAKERCGPTWATPLTAQLRAYEREQLARGGTGG